VVRGYPIFVYRLDLSGYGRPFILGIIMDDLLIVTGASSNHFNCLKNLLFSISFFEAGTSIAVIDLGLRDREIKELKWRGYDPIRFPFEKYPPHFNIKVQKGQFAWKPVIIAEQFRNCEKSLLWLDAGDLLHCRLDRIRHILNTQGFYSPKTSGTVGQWTHPGTLECLGATPDILSLSNRNGAIIGFSRTHPGIPEFIDRFEACAVNVNCIFPPGASRLNHRQEQAVLSVLACQFQKKYGIQLIDEMIDISNYNDRLKGPEVLAKLKIDALSLRRIVRCRL
jgi:hypothetical protein